MAKAKQRAPKVLVDTSVLIAGIAALKKPPIAPYNESQRVLRLCRSERFQWVLSAEILEEYKAVMKALKIRPHTAGAVINHLRAAALFVEPVSDVQLSLDPNDDCFYACALAAGADYIVTLNTKDFPQIGRRPKILTPAQFVQLFGES